MTVVSIDLYKDYKEVAKVFPVSFNGYWNQVQDDLNTKLQKELERVQLQQAYDDGHTYTDLDEYGNLQYCSSCMGMEGSLPTYCPKQTMTEEQSNAVYRGNLDYRKEDGWVNELSPMGRSMLLSKTYDQLRGRERQLTNAELAMALGISMKQLKDAQRPILQRFYKKEYEGDDD